MIRVAVLAPLNTSLYSRTVAHLLAAEPDIHLTDVVYRTPWTYKRIRNELKRDGPRLLRKAYRKLMLADDFYDAADDDTLKRYAARHGLAADSLTELATIHGFQVTRVKDHNDPQSVKTLKEARPDVIVFTGGGLIRKAILEIPTHGVLNAHMGNLPQYRGMDVVEWPILEAPQGEPPLIGLTIHFMDRGVDTGPIILRREVPLRTPDNIASIRLRFESQLVIGLLEAVRAVRDGTCVPEEQRLAEGRQYFVMHRRLQEFLSQRIS